MPYKNLQHFIQTLNDANELLKIKEYVSPELEIAEVTDRIVKSGGKALLFENTGTEFPLLINALGSEKRMCLALGVKHLDDISHEIEKIFQKVTTSKNTFFDKLKMLPMLNRVSSYMPKLINKKGSCQQVIMETPDLLKLPILKCWIFDGGPFITLPVVHTAHPKTKVRNQGMYRMQVFSKDATGMHWHLHKGAAQHYDEYKKAGIRKMPVVVTLGGDPIYTYIATAPLPDNIDEYIFAGFIRKKRVTLVKCISCELHVPADADFVIEGFIDTTEELMIEGPFGDHTGYYSLPDMYPKFHVTCITHRKNAVYPATIVGIPPQEDAWIAKATERIFITPLRLTTLPEIIDMNMPIEGVFHNITFVKIKNLFFGNTIKVMNSLWGAGQMMFNKIMIVLYDDVDIHDYQAVATAISTNTDTDKDIYITKGPLDVLDHSSNTNAFGGKIGIDATSKYKTQNTITIALPDNLVDFLKKKYVEITAVNDNLTKQGIASLILSVKKKHLNHIASLHEQIVKHETLSGIKFIFYLDFNVDIFDIINVVWRFANNIDAYRDVHKITSNKGDAIIIGIDGTTKTKQHDGFMRDWPNIVVSDDKTIKAIDEKWNRLGLGEFIPSPSLKYKNQVFGDGAIVKDIYS